MIEHCSRYLLLHNKPCQSFASYNNNCIKLTESVKKEFKKGSEGEALLGFTMFGPSAWVTSEEPHTVRTRTAGRGGRPPRWLLESQARSLDRDGGRTRSARTVDHRTYIWPYQHGQTSQGHWKLYVEAEGSKNKCPQLHKRKLCGYL